MCDHVWDVFFIYALLLDANQRNVPLDLAHNALTMPNVYVQPLMLAMNVSLALVRNFGIMHVIFVVR